MAVEVLKPVKHDGVLHQVGAVIHNLTDDVKAELVKLGVVKDLEQDAGHVEEQLKEDAHTVAGQAQEDADLVRGQAEAAAHSNAQQDVEDAKAALAADGTPVAESGKPQEGQQTPPAGNAAPAAGQAQEAPAAPANGQPTASDIANDPDLQ